MIKSYVQQQKIKLLKRLIKKITYQSPHLGKTKAEAVANILDILYKELDREKGEK